MSLSVHTRIAAGEDYIVVSQLGSPFGARLMLDPRFDTSPQFDTRPAPPRDATAAAFLRDNPGASQPRPDDASIDAALRMIRLRLSRLPSGGGVFVDDLVDELKKEGLEEFVIRWAIHQGRASRCRANEGSWLDRPEGDSFERELHAIRRRGSSGLAPIAPFRWDAP